MSASAAIANTEDLQATVYQTNHIGTSFSYSFGPADGLLPGQTYTVSLQHLKESCTVGACSARAGCEYSSPLTQGKGPCLGCVH